MCGEFEVIPIAKDNIALKNRLEQYALFYNPVTFL